MKRETRLRLSMCLGEVHGRFQQLTDEHHHLGSDCGQPLLGSLAWHRRYGCRCHALLLTGSKLSFKQMKQS